MSSKNFNPNEFIDQQDVFGHGSAFGIPLATSLSEQAKEQLKSAYIAWLAQSEFAESIVFLDITFAPTGALELSTDVYTLMLAHDPQSLDTYKQLLQSFIGQHKSIAAHPDFRRGLPDTDPLRDHNAGVPQSQNFLLWLDDQTTPAKTDSSGGMPRSSTCAGGDITFLGDITPTYKTAEEVSKSQSPTAAVEAPLNQRWSDFVELLRTNRDNLRSYSSGKHEEDVLGVVGAFPLGVSHPDRPEYFIRVADVFFGLNRRSNRQMALSFLRFLSLQLLRNNVAVRTTEMAEWSIIASIGHEIKRVTGMIGNLWVPPASVLFDISVGKMPSRPTVPVSERKLGRIEIDPQYEFLSNSIHIAPFGDLLRAARRTIDFWAFSSSLEDLPTQSTDETSLNVNRNPKDWVELVQFAWQSALDQVIMFFMSSSSAHNPLAIESRLNEIRQLQALFRPQSPIVDGSGVAAMGQPGWDYDTPSVKKQIFAVLRVLMAWFGNCVEHGGFSSPIEVSLKSLNQGRRRLTIENAERGPDEILPEFVKKQRTRAVITGAPKTEHVIRVSLREINGELEYPHMKNDRGKWVLGCEFDWSLSDGR